MNNMVLEKYRNLKPINDIATTDAMLRVLVEIPNERQEDMWLRDNRAGQVCIYRDPRFPGKVLEYAMGSKDDSVTTLYEDVGLYQTRQQVLDMRKEIIEEIGRICLSLPDMVTVFDSGREREVFLRECGTVQLFDLLAAMSGRDFKVV